MCDTFLDPGGMIVPTTALTVSLAKDLTKLLGAGVLPYASLVECRRSAGPPPAETVVFTVEVERLQDRVHDIRRFERISVTFQVDDDRMPEVLALRPDFPSVPHLNLRRAETPRSLCLYDQSWDALKLRWTPGTFVERVREWLALTAAGKVHQDDQPLEPLFFDGGLRIVLPADLFTKSGTSHEKLFVWLAGTDKTDRVLRAQRPGSRYGPEEGLKYVATAFQCAPQQHGTIKCAPRNLRDLHDFLLAAGFDLRAELRTRLRSWDRTEKGLLARKLILIIAFPKTRDGGAIVEATDIWAFLTGTSVKDVGAEIGAWAVTDGRVGVLLGDDGAKDGSSIELDLLTPHLALTPDAAARYNGLKEADKRKIVAVGAGALGSQVLMNLMRAGYGRWAVADEDYLLPHNVARHSLISIVVGFPKAGAIAENMNFLFEDDAVAKGIKANVLHPADATKELEAAFSEAGLILDMSADVAVARHLANNVNATARRMSIFLNPSGTDLVMLAEDEARTLRLDFLEMQYYRELSSNSALDGHLKRTDGRIRYAQSCRDVSSTIPQHLVALHAAIASKTVREAAESADPSIRVWRVDPRTMSVSALNIPTVPVTTGRFGDWTLQTDRRFIDKIHALRDTKLPNETGGILVGSFDVSRKIVYVVDTIPSPPDSQEWPTLYIRGSEQLKKQLDEIKERTAQNLEYVGEWHSHPSGHGCAPSPDDHKVFAWLTESMDADGLPALMLIAGHGGEYCFFLGRMA